MEGKLRVEMRKLIEVDYNQSIIIIIMNMLKLGDTTKPQPYKSDLEYLEDNFQLIETKAKALKMEQSDDSFLLRADQRKPEAVIREMKAKARSLQAKIDQRMLATHKEGGGFDCNGGLYLVRILSIRVASQA